MRNVLFSPWRGGTPRRLAEALDLVLVSPYRTVNLIQKNKRVLVNWGVTSTKLGTFLNVLNHPGSVGIAANKLTTFKLLERCKIPTLEFTTDRDKALEWNKKHSVVAHNDLHGHGGEGLTLHKKLEGNLYSAKVFTKYFPKKVESRVLVIKTPTGIKHFYLEKKRVLKDRWEEFGLEDSPSTYIRTYGNGWIFSRQATENAKAIELAKKTIDVIGLDYGAVDILTSGLVNLVGEVNTAPGLEGASLTFFIDNLSEMLK